MMDKAKVQNMMNTSASTRALDPANPAADPVDPADPAERRGLQSTSRVSSDNKCQASLIATMIINESNNEYFILSSLRCLHYYTYYTSLVQC